MPSDAEMTPPHHHILASRMDMYDDLEEGLAELVQEYGLKEAMEVGRVFYGRWREARRELEARRLVREQSRWCVRR